MSYKSYEALGPNVFVKETEKEFKKDEWIIPDSLDIDFTFGEIVSCSDGYYDHGLFINHNFVIGDKVVFPKISGTKINLDGNKYIKVHSADIIAKEVSEKTC